MKREPVTEARLEAALIQCAEIAAADPRYMPIFERIDRELFARRDSDLVARARSLLRNPQQEPTHELRTT